jgi:GDPmannose 4,6-dehydratase
MFGAAEEVPQNELTRFHPRSPYGVAKVFAHHMTINYRESYKMFACSGILFNHEGWRRGPEFVTRKISRAAARIKLGLQDKLTLGNLESKRDWGYAGDYVQAMHLMLQQERPDDYVIGTGECYSVRDFAEAAFGCLGLNWEEYVTLDSSLLRPAEVDILQADPAKARRALGWKPKVTFDGLVQLMVESDLKIESALAR